MLFLNCRVEEGNVNDTDMKLGDNIEVKKELSYDDYIKILKGMKPILPIKGSHITTSTGQLPNAPRKYRYGIHEGFDFYDGFCGVKIEKGTPVLAISNGKVIRADTNYKEIGAGKRKELLKEARQLGYTPETTLDILRGRQVWLEHSNGIITRYCHLSGISKEIKVDVQKGNILGFVGGSGTSSKTPHLHFEIRLGKDFLGKGKSPEEIKQLMDEIFKK